MLVLTLNAPTGACPVCDTGTGRQVRAGIFDDNFGRTLLAVAVPFPILLAVVAAIHFGWPATPRSGNNLPDGEPRHDDDDSGR
jgi:hypothetical protein